MKTSIPFKRIFVFVVFCIVSALSLQLKAQSPSFSVSPTLQCFGTIGTTTSSAGVLSPTATSYSWTSQPSGTCSPVISVTSANGSLVSIYYPCCGIYTINCSAYNGINLMGTSVVTSTVLCPPYVFITGNQNVCSGVQTMLSAQGAQTYTWNSGQTSSSITVSPTITTVFSVTGANSSNGCTDSASITVNVTQPIVANFTYTLGANGQVTFSNTTTNQVPGLTSYTWTLGNGNVSSAMNPVATYSSNGIYTITLVASSTCVTSSITRTLQIASVIPTCPVSFTLNGLPGGSTTFTSTSAGTSSNSIYYWNFGNNMTYSAVGTSTANVMYTSGIYTVTLMVVNPSTGCTASASSVFNLSVCSLTAALASIHTGNSTMSFSSTSIGTSSSSTYVWTYGDGSPSGTGVLSTHTYTVAGTYIVYLSVTNSTNCSSSYSAAITVSACTLGSNFTHTVGPDGMATFKSTSTPTSAALSYYWNFGDGVYSLAQNPQHTYSNAGTYLVSLRITDNTNFYCFDTLAQYINITNVGCSANSNFTVMPTNTLHYWNAIPSFPYNVVAATWSWGDGTTDTTLYTSHTYSVAGNYSICLSVTVSCGSSSTYCFLYSINKPNDNASQIVNINVLQPAMSTGVAELKEKDLSFTLYPNPNDGIFNLSFGNFKEKNFRVSVYSLIGTLVYTSDDEAPGDTFIKTFDLTRAGNGIYFVNITSGSKSFTQKIVVSK